MAAASLQTLRVVGNLSLCDANTPLMVEHGVLTELVRGMAASMTDAKLVLMTLQVLKNMLCSRKTSLASGKSVKVGRRHVASAVAAHDM